MKLADICILTEDVPLLTRFYEKVLQVKANVMKLGEEGYKVISDEKGASWFFERCTCPRFTTPDDQGNIILDVCHFIE